MVCDENDNSFDILVKKYQPLIYKISQEYHFSCKKIGYEIEDLMQIGYITLYKALFLYSVDNEAIFYTYFVRSFHNAIIAIIRNNTTNKKKVLNKALSYDLEIPNTNLTYIELFKDEKTYPDYSHELVIFKNSMPYILSAIFELFYNGYSKEEISLLLDENLDSVKNMFLKIRKHALTYKYLFFK